MAYLSLPTSLDEIPPAPRKPSRRARTLVFSFRGAPILKLAGGLLFLGLGALFSTILTGQTYPQSTG